MINLRQKLLRLGLDLPSAPTPVGAYSATISSENLLYISGQLPFKNSTLIYTGKIGQDLTIEEGYEAAKLCTLNILAQMENNLQKNNFKRIIKIEGFINCSSSFEQHAEVLNGASDLLSKLFLKKAGHVRTVMGCNSLPFNAAIEISALVETY